MNTTRRKVIKLETRSQTVIYRGGVRYEIRCDVCGSESISVLPEGSTEDELRRYESRLLSGTCLDTACTQMLEADTLRQF